MNKHLHVCAQHQHAGQWPCKKCAELSAQAPSSANAEQIEASGLHWVLCGGLSVGLSREPKVWRLRPKDDLIRQRQRTKDLQRMAGMAKLISEVMEWHKDPDSPEYNQCDESPCHWCEMAARLLSLND